MGQQGGSQGEKSAAKSPKQIKEYVLWERP